MICSAQSLYVVYWPAVLDFIISQCELRVPFFWLGTEENVANEQPFEWRLLPFFDIPIFDEF